MDFVSFLRRIEELPDIDHMHYTWTVYMYAQLSGVSDQVSILDCPELAEKFNC